MLRFYFYQMGCCESKDDSSSIMELTYNEERFLSARKCVVLSSSDRVSKFELIADEFEKAFGHEINYETLSNYYEHK